MTKNQMRCSLHSLDGGVIQGIIQRIILGLIKGDTRSLDNGSNGKEYE